MKDIAIYITLSTTTLIIVYVWARISLDRREMVDIPYPIIVVLLFAWGLKVPTEIFSIFTG